MLHAFTTAASCFFFFNFFLNIIPQKILDQIGGWKKDKGGYKKSIRNRYVNTHIVTLCWKYYHNKSRTILVFFLRQHLSPKDSKWTSTVISFCVGLPRRRLWERAWNSEGWQHNLVLPGSLISCKLYPGGYLPLHYIYVYWEPKCCEEMTDMEKDKLNGHFLLVSLTNQRTGPLQPWIFRSQLGDLSCWELCLRHRD